MTANENSFDGHYYNEVVDQVGKGGWFNSDRNLSIANTPTVRGCTVQQFSCLCTATLWQRLLLGPGNRCNGPTP